MKNILKLEELAMFGISIFYLSTIPIEFSRWWYLALFFAPDISILGYVLNKKLGAICYNLFHHKLIAIGILAIGLATSNAYITMSGTVLFGHSSFDRIMGYGLKYFDGFKHTHLGWMK